MIVPMYHKNQLVNESEVLFFSLEFIYFPILLLKYSLVS